MRIKNFEAGNMSEAMQMVRRELGGDAVILSSYNLAGKVFLTAGVDDSLDFDFNNDNQIQTVDVKAHFDETELREALEYHDVMDAVKGRILASCRETYRTNPGMGARMVLEVALDNLFAFHSVLDCRNKVKMFMGTPGSGKSTAIAKVGTKARLKNLRAAIISTDHSKAGANKQLEAFAEILDVPFYFIKDARSLFDFIQHPPSDFDLFLIDTPGINPFLEREVQKVAPFAEAVKCDKILTFDAGRNIRDALESAEVFTDLGVRYLLPTRMDLTRRIGSVLTVADYCKLSFCAASIGSSIAAGLAPVDSKSLAKLILE